MQTGVTTKILINIALTLISIVIGVILHKTSKPYNVIYLTIHKLVTIGFVIFTSMILLNYIKTNGFNTVLLDLMISVGLSLITLFISGAMLSLDKFHNTMQSIYKISTLVFLICSTSLFYSLLKH